MRVRKDAAELPVSITVAPIRDEDGEIVGASAVHRDATEQRRAFEVGQRVAAMVEFSAEAIAGAMLEGIVTCWNPAPSGQGSLTLEQQRDLERSIVRMRDVVPVDAATSAQYPAVSAEARQQPDLYAAAFVRELLTQDYRASVREELLAWVQSESAQSTEPLVVGLTPVELRSRMAVASVQDGVNGSSPVPTQSAWAELAVRQGHTTVQIQHVSEPVSWASAVANAQITDPGVTARQVDAELTLQTTNQGKTTLQRFSVSLVINLEGPPVRDVYGFVAAITYNVVKVN